MAAQRRRGPKPPPAGSAPTPKGKATSRESTASQRTFISFKRSPKLEAKVREMSRSEFKEWALLIEDEGERGAWRKFRRDIAKRRYEQERRPLLFAEGQQPERSEVTSAIERAEGLTGPQLKELLAELPEDARAEVRRHLKRVAWRRWQANHAEAHRARAKSNW